MKEKFSITATQNLEKNKAKINGCLSPKLSYQQLKIETEYDIKIHSVYIEDLEKTQEKNFFKKSYETERSVFIENWIYTNTEEQGIYILENIKDIDFFKFELMKTLNHSSPSPFISKYIVNRLRAEMMRDICRFIGDIHVDLGKNFFEEYSVKETINNYEMTLDIFSEQKND